MLPRVAFPLFWELKRVKPPVGVSCGKAPAIGILCASDLKVFPFFLFLCWPSKSPFLPFSPPSIFRLFLHRTANRTHLNRFLGRVCLVFLLPHCFFEVLFFEPLPHCVDAFFFFGPIGIVRVGLVKSCEGSNRNCFHFAIFGSSSSPTSPCVFAATTFPPFFLGC